jgi:hypothetical protein
MAESINGPSFRAKKCDTWEEFQSGVCDGNAEEDMGFGGEHEG